MNAVFIVRSCQYWHNFRGERGSVHSIEHVFDSEDKAKKYIANFRRSGVDAQTKDTSDEPDRWLRRVEELRVFVRDNGWARKSTDELCRYLHVSAEERMAYFGY